MHIDDPIVERLVVVMEWAAIGEGDSSRNPDALNRVHESSELKGTMLAVIGVAGYEAARWTEGNVLFFLFSARRHARAYKIQNENV